MKQLLFLLLLLTVGCVQVPTYQPHFYVYADRDNVEVDHIDRQGNRSMVKSCKTVSEADALVRKLNEETKEDGK